MVGAAVAGPLVEILGRVVEGVWRARRPANSRPVGTLADLLAKAVGKQWRQEAAKRMLLTPAPIPVGWSLSELPVTGPVEAAVGDPEVAAFPPLPGQSQVTEEDLRAGGGRRELFAVYAGIASGRVVVVGAPGAGKTGTAILLLLDALEHRDCVEDTRRFLVPVPVLVTDCDGWDPVTCPARDWLVDWLVTSYPQLFQHRGGRAEAAELVAAEAVALVLDGLDEMDVARRPAALRALSDAPLRVVVLTRGREMVQAARVAWLVGALALQLREVTGPKGAEYLHRARSEPPPSGWTALLTHLRGNPDSALTRGLSTPLALTLIRDTYQPGDDLTDLLDGTRWSTTEDLERYLIARVVPAAYTRRSGRPAPRYSQTQAEQALAFLARQMDQDHISDLAWWQIHRWAPTTPRILTSMLAVGLLSAILSGLAFVVPVVLVRVVLAFVHGLRQGLSTGLGNSLLLGLAFGLGVGLPLGIGFGRGGREPKRVRNWRAISWRSVLTAGLVYGLVSGLAGELVARLMLDLTAIPDRLDRSVGRLVIELVYGLAVGLTLGLSGWRGEGQGSSQELVRSRRNNRLFGPVAGLLLGLMSRLEGGFVAGLAVGSADGEPSPQGPRETWRNDRAFGLRVGLVFGLGVGLGVGLVLGFRGGLALGLRNFLVVGFSVGLVYGITSSVTWPTTLAWRQLRRARRVPAVALMPFLEDARGRGVLRTVGAVYQFRHATLQDTLAGQPILSPLTAPTAKIRT